MSFQLIGESPVVPAIYFPTKISGLKVDTIIG